MYVLCKVDITSQGIPPWFHFEVNIYIPCKVHWSVRYMNLNCIYLQRYIVTRPCVKMLRSANPWMNVLKWRNLPTDFPCSGSRSSGHCVGTMSIGHTSNESESDVLTKRDMQNIQSGGREDWNWEPLLLWSHPSILLCPFLVYEWLCVLFVLTSLC